MRAFRLTLAAVCTATAIVPAIGQTYHDRGPGYGPAYGYGPGYGSGYGPGVEYAPRPYYAPGAFPPGFYEGRSAQQIDQDENHRSGTLGRMGLGADPHHPEGPGNAAIGGFR